MKDYIESMSFEEKIEKLQRGIEIPPPEKVARKLDSEKVFEIASQYLNRGSFKKGHPTAYRWACRKGVIDEMCEHMVLLRKPRNSHARS